jgi:L-seryl-tRNA(Ser) seleniumtransferase
MMSATADELRARAEGLAAVLGAAGVMVAVEACRSTVGGGAMPTAELPSWAVTVAGSAEATDAKLRGAAVPVVARVADGKVWIDLRTVGDGEVEDVVKALGAT